MEDEELVSSLTRWVDTHADVDYTAHAAHIAAAHAEHVAAAHTDHVSAAHAASAQAVHDAYAQAAAAYSAAHAGEGLGGEMMASELQETFKHLMKEFLPEDVVQLPEHTVSALTKRAVSALPGSIGMYIYCHGGLSHPHIHTIIPEGLVFMKKNSTGCGDVAYELQRTTGITNNDIARRLQRSFDIAFSAEECAHYPFHEEYANADQIDRAKFTCPEYNTTSTNQVKGFLYKEFYITDFPRGGIFVAYNDVIVNLFTINFEEFIRAFNIPYPGLSPRPDPPLSIEKVVEIVKLSNSIKAFIAFRNEHEFITNDFVIGIAYLLHMVHGVRIVRCLDESCNDGIGSLKKPDDLGHGGKSRKQKKRKKRKSKKLRK